MPVAQPPNFYKMQWATDSGAMTSASHLYFDQQSQTVQQMAAMFNVALVAPQKTTAEITALEPQAEIGSIWFDTDVAKLKVKTASGTVETITSS